MENSYFQYLFNNAHQQLICMKKTYIIFVVFSVSILAGCKKEIKQDIGSNDILQNANSSQAAHEIINGAGKNHVPNEVLVKFKEGLSDAVRNYVLGRIGGSAKEKVLTKAMERFGDN